MKRSHLWLAAMAFATAVSSAAAQGTAVQLPTYSFFNTNTTVSVPDRGSAYLGGIKRAASGVNESRVPLLPFAPFKNRGIGMERSSSSTSVNVYIHDFEELEEELLGRSSGGMAHQLMPRDAGRSDPRMARNRGTAATAQAAAGASARQSPVQRTPEEETRQYLDRARQLESEGKGNIAIIYYRMAARRATGELQQEIAARMKVLQSVRPETRVAQQDREVATSQ